MRVQNRKTLTNRDKDIERKREANSEAARIEIPSCKNPQRRERCLADPELFLKTYFKSRYTRPFGKVHKSLITAIYDIATKGGRQSLAAPRGRGKTELTKGMLAYIIFAGFRRFPVPIGQTAEHARQIYQDFRDKLILSDLLAEDFPEVCYPVIDLDDAALRAKKQHVDGDKTRIIWKAEELRLPNIAERYRGDIDYGGVRMVYRGLDAAIRGINMGGDRPDFVLIDDPETRESAKSPSQTENREAIIDRDVAGIAGEGVDLAMVMLTTVQNRTCLSYRYTDRSQKPAWNGMRFAWVEQWPNRMDLWEEYISLRQKAQVEGDRYGKAAIAFYLSNQEMMDEGTELLSDNYTEARDDDDNIVVHSAIQEVFNKIADTSIESFYTEYQNDPPEDEKPQDNGLTAGIVQTRISGLMKNELPRNEQCKITVGLDIGDHSSHWVKIAWFGNATGVVLDYGIMETGGDPSINPNEQLTRRLLASLYDWRTMIIAENRPDFCLIDSGSGTHQPAVYEFARKAGFGFEASKGWDSGRFRASTNSTATRRNFDHCVASQQAADLWLYNVNTEHWKYWVQERFLTQTFDENQQFNDGSLSLFSVPGKQKEHLSFSQHVVSERKVDMFVEGKGWTTKWYVEKRNNHWLDALALAACSAGILGIRLIPKVNDLVEQANKEAAEKPAKQPPRPQLARSRFLRRDKGWVPRR